MNDTTKQDVNTPAKESTTTTPEPEKTGLDIFSELFQTKEHEKSGDPQPYVSPTDLLKDQGNIDTLMEKLDFAKDIPQDIITSIGEGKPEGLMGLVNHVAKQAYTSALQHSTSLMDGHINHTISQLKPELQGLVADKLADSTIQQEIPELEHPAVAAAIKPFINALRSSDPNIKSSDIKEKVKAYAKELHTSLNGVPPVPGSDTKAIDWLEFANS